MRSKLLEAVRDEVGRKNPNHARGEIFLSRIREALAEEPTDILAIRRREDVSSFSEKLYQASIKPIDETYAGMLVHQLLGFLTIED